MHHIALFGILINASTQVFKVRNMIVGGGVLPSAGDGRGIIIGDVVGAFVVGLPLAIVLGSVYPAGRLGRLRGPQPGGNLKVGIFEMAAPARELARLAQQQRGQEVVAAH